MSFESGEFIRVLSRLKEQVAGVQQYIQWRRLPSFTEDRAYIEEFKSKLNEAMGAFNVCKLFLSLIDSLLPKFQAFQILEGNLYKTSMSNCLLFYSAYFF